MSSDMGAKCEIQDLFPNLGFFGAESSQRLRISIEDSIIGFRLSVSSVQPTYLNLGGVDIVVNGSRLAIDELPPYEEYISTSYHDDDRPIALLKGVGIHSKAELHPSWSVLFDSKLYVGEVVVANRKDRWCCRSRKLVLEVLSPDGSWKTIFANGAEFCAIQTVAGLAAKGYLQPIRQQSFAELRADTTKLISEKLIGLNASAYGRQNWLNILSLIDLDVKKELDDSELTIVAAFIYSQLADGADFSFAYFAARLYSVRQLARLEQRLNQLLANQVEERYTLTRHGLQKQGRLIAQKDKFISSALRTIQILERDGRHPVLAYGTLLGAVREGGLIEHDDDLDLLCCVNACNAETARVAMGEIIANLNSAGMQAKFADKSSLNLHVYDPDNGALIDLFPYWIIGASAYLHMENMNVRPIDKTIFDETHVIQMYGKSFPVPGRYEDFLEERYGSSWRVPMKYFEWPWKLTKELGDAE